MDTGDKILAFLVSVFVVATVVFLAAIIICAVHSEFYGDPMTQALAARYGEGR